MTEAQAILVHVEAGVLTLTFNRLDKKNAITTAMYTSLADALTEAATDSAVRAVVIQGHEQIFTAGNDLADFKKNPPSADQMESMPVFRFLEALRTFPKPLVAAVSGPAVGIGTTLLLHCDLVYAGDNAAFSLPFVNLGLCPEAGASLLLPAQVGYLRAAEKLMLGEAFYAEEAVDMGLVNRILPPHEVAGYAQAQALKLAAKPAESLRITKALMKQAHPSLSAVMKQEFSHFGELLRGPAAKEAISAVMEKRRPDFSKL
ncbi:MAG: enoyl-CoA hydratase [Aquabacterium sp.]|uniref:enoyl-CoA hydratase n=1 Tax=Aquabacterium sp. TaxID=1872578 RepID=UPI0027247E45|nr:enoyl-CoA hydratase [Aquabacterium sp.]MDO9004279.1 enoyl-CoA hydratase [Aquabacterium sp.]